LHSKYTYDQVLTLISVYWLQGNILSSQRFYKENAAVIGGGDPYTARFVSVPTGYAAFAHDLGGPQPRELVALSYNLKHMTVFADGGHFAALEQPTVLATDVLRFTNRQLLGL
jgi:pimeloyl-ACP methyl ester carboxylesterase